MILDRGHRHLKRFHPAVKVHASTIRFNQSNEKGLKIDSNLIKRHLNNN